MSKTRTSAEVKNRYNAKAYDRIALSVPKGTKAEWQDRAAGVLLIPKHRAIYQTAANHRRRPLLAAELQKEREP